MNAKLRMLEFAYFLFKHLDFDYMSFGRGSLEECVLPEMKRSWNELKNNFFPNGIDTDGRTLGLFKDEFVGTKFCGLSSKKN